MADPAQQQHEPFKTCTMCGHNWSTREAFLADPAVELVGYQAFLDDLVLGLFLFNHLTCETTMAIQAQAFVDLYDGPVFSERLTGTECCTGHCLNESDLQPCPNQCECAYVREVLQIVKSWPRGNAAP